MTGPSPTSRRWTWPAVILASAVPAAVGLRVYGQGFDLLADGSWLLAARTWIRTGSVYPHLAVDLAPGTVAYLVAFCGSLKVSGATLALAKTVATAWTAGAGFVLARRATAGALAWLAPVGALALGPVTPLAAALTLVLLAATAATPRLGLLVVATAVLAIFGAPAAVLAASVTMTASPATPRARGLLAGTAIIALFLSALAAAGTDVAVTWSHVGHDVLAGVSSVVDGFPAEPWLRVVRGDWTTPFASVATGENLSPVFGGHRILRQVAAVVWVGLPLAVLIAAWSPSGRHRARLPLRVAHTLCLVAWALTPAARELAWLTTVWTGAGLAGSRRIPRGLAVAVATLALGPNLLETGWLSLHASRPGLELWDRPAARVLMARDRIEHWESIFAALRPDLGSTPVLFWPNRPGLAVVFDQDLPTRQATLRVGDRVDVPAVLDDLEANAPAAVVLALGDTRATLRLRQHWPAIWDYLRMHYQVTGNVPGGGDPARVLRRVTDPTTLDDLSLPERLADVEIPVSNEAGPAMRPGLSVGQTLVVGPEDLRGFSVRWHTAGRPVEVPARVRVWQRRGREYDALIEFLDVHLVIPSNGYRSFLRFDPPIHDTAGKDLAITVELREDTVDEVRLLWHRHEAPHRDVDIYPEGTAVVNRRPVPADLYFFSY